MGMQRFLDDIAEYIRATFEIRIKIIVEARGACIPEVRDDPYRRNSFHILLYEVLRDCFSNGMFVYIRMIWEYGRMVLPYKLEVLNCIITRFL